MGSHLFRPRLDFRGHRLGFSTASVGGSAVFRAHGATRNAHDPICAAHRAGAPDDRMSQSAAGNLGLPSRALWKFIALANILARPHLSPFRLAGPCRRALDMAYSLSVPGGP